MNLPESNEGWCSVTRNVCALPLLSAAICLAAGCSSLPRAKTDPFYVSFYQKTQLIMLDAEKKVYRLLEDKAAKEEFIRKFWRIRDPEPGTEENEAKTAFEERVRYACRWFSYRILTSKLKENYDPTKQDWGWQTDMGRIYIVLGPPDYIVFEGGHITAGDVDRGEIIWTGGKETWFYNNPYLKLTFERTELAGGMAFHYLLLQTMKETVLDMVSPGERLDVKQVLRFKAKYRSGAVALRVPTTRISFKEEAGKLWANFKVKMTVYRNGQQVEVLEKAERLETTEDDLAEQESLSLTIPYPLRDEGLYLFDIILEDLNSLVDSRSRATAKAKR
ncbi:MAG: GWxTD domain-containing protein [Candidatus Aminicenantes bacterium]|nr:GWxTD domain-containing protein [Candidatus Aminicenantes bacterium]